MHLRFSGIFNNCDCKFFTECVSERILKIGQYLAKIWTKVGGLLFGPPSIYELLVDFCAEYVLYWP